MKAGSERPFRKCVADVWPLKRVGAKVWEQRKDRACVHVCACVYAYVWLHIHVWLQQEDGRMAWSRENAADHLSRIGNTLRRHILWCCLGSNEYKSLRSGPGTLHSKNKPPDASETRCSLRAVGRRMSELTFGSEPLRHAPCPHLLPCSSQLSEVAHTFRSHPSLWRCVFRSPSLNALPHLVTWRNFIF